MANIIDDSATALAQKIKSKELSCVEVAKAFIDRITLVNPALNAIHQFEPERILQDAKKRDQDIAHGKALGKLHGVPVSMKNHCQVKGFHCDFGSYLFYGEKSNTNATIMQRLLDEGAILLGITNVPEMLAAYESDNLIYGKTNNPYDLTRTPGGSSGGEAALIAAGGSVLGVGSDAGGSIRQPAHVSGIAGHKPTQYCIPNAGLIPYDNLGLLSQILTFGPMARYVEDLELGLGILAGPDGLDPYCVPSQFTGTHNKPISELTIGYYGELPDVVLDADIKATINDVATTLKTLCKSVEQIEPFDHSKCYRMLWETLFFDGDAAQTVKSFIASHPDTKIGPFQHAVKRMERCEYNTAELRQRILEIDKFRRDILQATSRYDILICPVTATTAPLHGSTYDRFEDNIYCWPYNITGWPVTVIHCGMSKDHLPIGIQIVAKPWQDHLALNLAKILQEHYRPQRPVTPSV